MASPAPSPSPAPAPAPQLALLRGAFFGGNFSSGRTFNGAILADGSFYGIYSASGNSGLVGGLIQRSGSSSTNNTFTSSNIKDFNAEGLGVRDASMAATYDLNHSFGGTINYVVTSNPATPFNSLYVDQSGASALSLFAGTYSGSYVDSPGGRTTLNMTFDVGGNAAGTAASGCRLTGQISPISTTDVFVMSLTFGVAPCASPGQSFSGLAVYKESSRVVYGGAPSADRSSAIEFALTPLTP